MDVKRTSMQDKRIWLALQLIAAFLNNQLCENNYVCVHACMYVCMYVYLKYSYKGSNLEQSVWVQENKEDCLHLRLHHSHHM